MAKALVGHFVAPDPVALAQVQSLRHRVAELEARVLMLEAELSAAHPAAPVEPVASADVTDAEPVGADAEPVLV